MSIITDIISGIGGPKVPLSEEGRAKFFRIIHELIDNSTDIIGAMLTSGDGRPVVEILSPQAKSDAKRFAAMSSALLALSTSLAREAGSGETSNVLIEGTKGNIYVLSAGDGMVLTVFTSLKPNLGLSLAHARRAADNVTLTAAAAARAIADGDA